MDFVLSTPVEIHTIDVTDSDDPHVLQAIPESTAVSHGDTHSTSHTAEEVPLEDDAASSQEAEDASARGSAEGAQPSEDESDAESGDESDEESNEGSEQEVGYESSDESGDDDSGDESSDDSSDEEQPTSEKDEAFEYAEVIDDGSKPIPTDAPHDEDLGGEAIAAASTVAGVTALSSMRLRRNLIIGAIITALGAVALYYLWRKMQDMKKKICQLEQQQEMGLNDRDVQFISSQVLEDYLKQEAVPQHTTRVADLSSSAKDSAQRRQPATPDAADETLPEEAFNSRLDTIPEDTGAAETVDTREVESVLSDHGGVGDATSVAGAGDVSLAEDMAHTAVASDTDQLTEDALPEVHDVDQPQQPLHEDVLSDVGGVFDVPAGALAPEPQPSDGVFDVPAGALAPEPQPSDGVVEAKQPHRRRSRREKNKNYVESQSK